MREHLTTADGLLTSLWVGSAVCLLLRTRRKPATTYSDALHDTAATTARLGRAIAYRVRKGQYTPETALHDLSTLCSDQGNIVQALELYIASEEQ